MGVLRKELLISHGVGQEIKSLGVLQFCANHNDVLPMITLNIMTDKKQVEPKLVVAVLFSGFTFRRLSLFLCSQSFALFLLIFMNFHKNIPSEEDTHIINIINRNYRHLAR